MRWSTQCVSPSLALMTHGQNVKQTIIYESGWSLIRWFLWVEEGQFSSGIFDIIQMDQRNFCGSHLGSIYVHLYIANLPDQNSMVAVSWLLSSHWLKWIALVPTVRLGQPKQFQWEQAELKLNPAGNWKLAACSCDLFRQCLQLRTTGEGWKVTCLINVYPQAQVIFIRQQDVFF